MKLLSATLFACVMLFQSAFALNPSREYKQLPEKFNMVYKEFKVTTSDGATLNAWYFNGNKATTNLVLICHNGEGNMADYLRIVDQFTSIGYNTVIFDYRGYGKSSDFEIDNNMYIYPHFQDDLKAMIDYIRMNHVATFNIYGFGMGAGLAMGVGYNRIEIKKIIADTPFLSMEDLEKRSSKSSTPFEVPFAGYDKKHEPIYSLDNLSAKNLTGIMLIVGDADPLFKIDDMKTLQNKQKKLVKKLYIAVGGSGKDNFIVDKSTYFKEVRAFLESD